MAMRSRFDQQVMARRAQEQALHRGQRADV
jgi:hypothetical protein